MKRRAWLWLAMFELVAVTAAVPQAERTFTIRLVHAKNGRPMKGKVVDIWFGERANGAPLQIATGSDGAVRVPLTVAESTFVVAAEWMDDCRGGNRPGTSFVDANVYSISEVQLRGVVAANRCGNQTINPHAGTLILFVQPKHWWEKLRE